MGEKDLGDTVKYPPPRKKNNKKKNNAKSYKGYCGKP